MFALLSVAFLSSAGSHPESQSRTQIHVEGERATIELRFQALSLIEVVPELDTTQDGVLDAQEVDGAREVISDLARASAPAAPEARSR